MSIWLLIVPSTANHYRTALKVVLCSWCWLRQFCKCYCHQFHCANQLYALLSNRRSSPKIVLVQHTVEVSFLKRNLMTNKHKKQLCNEVGQYTYWYVIVLFGCLRGYSNHKYPLCSLSHLCLESCHSSFNNILSKKHMTGFCLLRIFLVEISLENYIPVFYKIMNSNPRNS